MKKNVFSAVVNMLAPAACPLSVLLFQHLTFWFLELSNWKVIWEGAYSNWSMAHTVSTFIAKYMSVV